MVEPSWSNICEVSGAALERPTSQITMLYWLLFAISYQWSVGFVCRCCFVFVAPEGSKSIKTSNAMHAPQANGRNHEPLHCAEARSPHSAEVLELRSSTKPRVCKALTRIPRMCSILLRQGVAAPRNPDCATYSSTPLTTAVADGPGGLDAPGHLHGSFDILALLILDGNVVAQGDDLAHVDFAVLSNHLAQGCPSTCQQCRAPLGLPLLLGNAWHPTFCRGA